MRVSNRLLAGLVTIAMLAPCLLLLSRSSMKTLEISKGMVGKKASVVLSRPEQRQEVPRKIRVSKPTKAPVPPTLTHQAGVSVTSSEMLSRVQWWKRHTSEACKALNVDRNERHITGDMLWHILVDDKNKLLYCQIPKVGSTTWRRIFLQLTGKLNTTNVMTMNPNDVHHKYAKLIPRLNEFSKAGIKKRLRTYFKFVFVREPFERILSAYINKFREIAKSNDIFKVKFGKRIVMQYREDPPEPSNMTGGEVTFKEFVTYLVDEHRKIEMNDHWQEFYKLCHPCLIDFDVIGHLERIDVDSDYILSANSLSDRFKVPKIVRTDKKPTRHHFKRYFSQLPKKTISRLYEMFKPDFMLFNYTIPKEVQTIWKNKH